MELYDIVIIGAGPAGLMAAGHASELGARVLVLEKNKQAGLKLLMTGGGRCNFTNNAPTKILAASFGQNGKWLLSGLSNFNSENIVNFLAARNIKSQANAEGKIYPENDNADAIRKALLNYVESNNGKIIYGSHVIKLVRDGNKVSKIILADRSEIKAKKFIIATGGNSYPLSGSSGDAYVWLKELGHKIIKPRPALCPIIVKENFIKNLEGLSFKNCSLSLYKNNKKIGGETGDFIFTAQGLSGPAALNLSRVITKEDKTGLIIKIDFFPEEAGTDLDKKICELIELNSRESIRNILNKLTQKRLVDFILDNKNIEISKKGADLAKLERNSIIKFLKELTLNILDLSGFNEAMVTSGGVDLKEVDQKTMVSKLYSNLYLAGEILDLDGPTGGYNLQVAWTTGYLAGESAALKQ
ncbi:MAG: BaiN/RdsA family NAD(P)/FAD-dependent oxidoreductase [Patescibacteria group bacterium]